MSKPLLPVGRDWVSPSLVWGEVALCRDQDGKLWFCAIGGEGEGWIPGHIATEMDIQAFRWCQLLAGKNVNQIPLD